MKSEKGFGVVEVLIVLVIIVAIGVGSWYVWQSNNTEVLNSPPALQTSDKYKDWKSFTFTYEKFSIKYPASFTLTDKSYVGEVATPGADAIRLTKPNGFTLNISTGIDGIGGACEECHVVYSQDITFLGQPAAVNYVASDNTDAIGSIVVTKESDDWFGVGLKGKNVTSAFDSQVLPMSINFNYQSGNAIVSKDLAELTASEDVKEAIKILESASY